MKRSAATITVCSLAESNRGYTSTISAHYDLFRLKYVQPSELRRMVGSRELCCPASVVGSSVPGASSGFRTSMSNGNVNGPLSDPLGGFLCDPFVPIPHQRFSDELYPSISWL